jgi:hypothetical protein
MRFYGTKSASSYHEIRQTRRGRNVLKKTMPAS